MAGGCKHSANSLTRCGRSWGHQSGGTGGTGAVTGVWSRWRRTKNGIQDHGQRHQSLMGWELGGWGLSTFSLSHEARFLFLGSKLWIFKLVSLGHLEETVEILKMQNLCCIFKE